MLTLRKRKIFILVCLIALVSTVLGVVFSNAASGDAASIQGALTEGRAFEKTEKLELQSDLKYMPKTYEAVVYVPKTAKTMGVIFGNYITATRSCFTFRISAAGKPELQIIDKDLNIVVSTFDYDIRGEAWVHVAITHEVLSGGDLFSCYINGSLIGTNKTARSYELDMNTAQSAVTPYIGKDFRNEYYFKGRIKNLALYTEALSADEIAASFNNGVGTHKSNLLALYDLSDADGTSFIADLTGGGYDFAPQYYEREEEKTDFAYSFAIVGDTQYLIYQDAYKGTSYTSYIYDWIVQNKTAKNIQFVMGLGDITDQNGVDKTANDGIDQTDKEWTLAVSEHQKLTDAGIPYTVIRGNHDTVPKLDEYFAGNSNFSALDTEYFEGESLGNYYVKFTVGETKYMILGLDYCLEAGSDEMLWANTAIEQNSDHKVIINTHYHVKYDGSRYGDIWDSLVTYNKNVIMVISGHVGKTANTAKSYSVGAAGHTVLELLVDPQYLDTNYVYKDVGMVGMLYFSEDGSKVDFEYISTQKTLTDGGADVFYGRKNQFSYTIPGEAETIMTKYGPISSQYADPTAYPFVVFDENGNCLGGAQKFYGADSDDSAVGIAKTHLANNTYSNGEPVGTPHTATILMRADHSLKNQWYNNFSQVKGTLIVDFNGYTLSTQTGNNADAVMLRCKHKTTGYPTELVFKNGTIALFHNPVLRLYGNVADKKMKFSFENVDFTVSGASSYLMAKYDATAEYDIFPEVTLTDCSIDISGSTASNIALFDVGSDKVHTTITVNGGKVITGGKAFTIFGKTNDATEGKLIFGEYEGAYMYLTLPNGTVPPSGDFVNGRGEKLIFAKYGTEDSTDIYRLTYEYVNTGYGIIPAEYTFTDKYPFVVFDENGNCIGGSDNFYTVVNSAKAYLQYNAYNGESYTYEGGAARQGIILMRCDHSILSTSYYDNISQVRGTITVDFDGYTLTRAGSDALMRSSMKAWASTASGDGRTVFPTEIVFTNGSIELQDGALAKYSASAEGKELTYRYIDINFSITGTTSALAATHSGTTGLGLKPEMYFENCTIDITGAKREDILLFNLGDETTFLDVYLSGCEIKTLGTAFTLFAKDNESSTGSFTISASDGVYNTLILPLGTAAPEISDIEFVKEAESADTVTYAMKSTLADIPSSVETEYGEIPAEYADAKLYPIVVFRSNREFVGAYSLWGGQDSTATGALPNAKVAGSVVLLRDNFTYAGGDYFNNLSQLNTGIVIDLGGFTFTVVHQPMFNAYKKTDYDTSITVKNGNIELSGGARVIKLNGNANGTAKFDFTFDNVNFKLLSAAGTADIICNTSFTGVPPTPVQFGITLNDCNIDLSLATKKVTLFNMSDELAKVTAIMKGGEIITSDSSVAFVNKENANADSSLTFSSDASGNYTTLVMPIANEAPTESFGGLKFTKTGDDGTMATYTILPPPVVTEYGEIPAEYTNAKLYPIVVFRSNREFVGAYSLWGGQDSTAKGALPNAKVAGSVVLLRDNFTYAGGDYFNNLSQLNTDIVIDLGGFTFTVVAQPMFNAQKKTDNNTSITVKNGNIALSGGARVIKLNGNAKGTGKFAFTFDNVNFKLLSTATVSNFICHTSFTGEPPTPVQFGITLNDCNIDLSLGTKKVTLFNMIDERAKVTAVMKGGNIIGSANSFTLANMDGGNAESSLTFEKNASGEFTTVILPSSVAFENITVNGDKYVFAKKSDNGTESTYLLTPTATQGLDFVPKTSITLGSELVYNVYVPVSDLLKSYTVNGLTFEDAEIVTLDDGKSYYRVAVSMPASEAAESIVLKVILAINGSEYAGSYTMSIPAYAKKIIEAETSPEEVTLVKDVLAYIRAAYVYFDAEGKDEAIATIDAILGDYKSDFAKVEGSTNTAEGLKTVIIALGAKPAIRFVIPEGASLDSYTFKAGNSVLDYTTGTYTEDGVDYTYAEVELYAYQLIGEITYTAGEYSGSYHINSYYDFVTTDETYKTDANLISLVEKLYSYCKSAEAYRASVTNS